MDHVMISYAVVDDLADVGAVICDAPIPLCPQPSCQAPTQTPPTHQPPCGQSLHQQVFHKSGAVQATLAA
jgi:hypothetical protein